MVQHIQGINIINTIQTHLFINYRKDDDDDDNDNKNKNKEENINEKHNNKLGTKIIQYSKKYTFPTNLLSNIGIFHIPLKNIQEDVFNAYFNNIEFIKFCFCAFDTHFDMDV